MELNERIHSTPTLNESAGRRELLLCVADKVLPSGRVYPADVLAAAAIRANTRAQRGELVGVAGGPGRGPELLDVVMRVAGVRFDGRQMFASFDTIPTAKGDDLRALLEAGVAVELSMRGIGAVKREQRGGGWVDVVQDYELIAVDVVMTDN